MLTNKICSIESLLCRERVRLHLFSRAECNNCSLQQREEKDCSMYIESEPCEQFRDYDGKMVQRRKRNSHLDLTAKRTITSFYKAASSSAILSISQEATAD